MNYKIIEKTIREESDPNLIFQLFELLNQQYNLEWSSSHLYENMASFCDLIGLKGFSAFFNKKSEEESEHAEELRQFILTNNFIAKIGSGSNPPVLDVSEDTLSLLNLALDHEKSITNNIEKILTFCRQNGILKVEPILLKFIEEQVEEEGEFLALIDNYEVMKEKGCVDFIFDNEIGSIEE